MDLYEKFSCYTNLPVLLDWVADQVREDCSIDELLFVPVKMDGTKVLGFHHSFNRTSDGVKTKCLHVYYSDELDRPERAFDRRVVVCKELLHAYDNDHETACSNEAVINLVEGIIIPPSLGMNASLASDHNGIFSALIVLMPRDALELINGGELGDALTEEEVSVMAEIPESYARLALSSIWQNILDRHSK